MAGTPKWFSDTADGHSQWYVERFRRLARDGVDLAGEARFVDALVPPGSRIMDAGCGPGRIAGELARRGHHVVGVDVDPVLLEAAVADHPGPLWVQCDLAELADPVEPYDAVVCAGNVMTFLAPGTERTVLRRLRAQLAPDGRLAIGFGLDRGYPLAAYDADIAAAGLVVQARFSTWDLRPFAPDSDYAVTLLAADGVPGEGATGEPVGA